MVGRSVLSSDFRSAVQFNARASIEIPGCSFRTLDDVPSQTAHRRSGGAVILNPGCKPAGSAPWTPSPDSPSRSTGPTVAAGAARRLPACESPDRKGPSRFFASHPLLVRLPDGLDRRTAAPPASSSSNSLSGNDEANNPG
ncbi:hypothetical protein OH77DRAFT_321519 [Trametes cingulata]|nr:hypothetical protein OH77DRAFT_321519 [Trametes cingulata]